MSLKKQQGFTLVELVIVLAIAAIIIAGVLVAVGGAQRSQRDTARKDEAAQLSTALQNYASNNDGALPAVGTALASNYMTSLKDPDNSTGKPVAGAAGATATASSGVTYVTPSAKCTQAAGSGKVGPAVAATGTRSYAILYWSENANAAQCIDNQ